MNKLPTKQIYLLVLIITGIVALSVYSTYAIFTFESESSNIVSIHTPNSLNISSEAYEYKQVTVSKNSYITTDIDIYNNYDYELCYSIWYKIVANSSIDNNKIKIYQNTDSSVSTSSTISSVKSRRISLIIINDNDNDAKINIGVAHAKNEGTCALNISSDKSLITANLNNPKELSDNLVKEVKVKNNEAGYLTYKDNTDEITLSNDSKIYVSNEFTYKDELFILKEPKEIESKDIKDYNNYYTCIDTNECEFLYHITEIKEEEKDNNQKDYKITKYDILKGYLSSEVGLRKITKDNIDNYYFYGDNPDNFIYYNCTNELDTKTCELWRIIGFTYDNKEQKYITKIIRNESIGTYEYDDDANRWKESTISKYFDKDYKLNNINILQEITFKEENIVDLDIDLKKIPLLDEENKSKITIMNLSDYLYASSCADKLINEYDELCLKNNWLNINNNIFEWTMTTKIEEPYLDEETNETVTPDNNTLYSVGSNITESVFNEKLNIRPVVYLKSRTLLVSGEGTFDNPYIVR